ncbi:hypothetical protein DP643_27020 [Salmonella enterica]|nr:hypothetical protein [Salmonella enterica]
MKIFEKKADPFFFLLIFCFYLVFCQKERILESPVLGKNGIFRSFLVFVYFLTVFLRTTF